MWMNLENIMPNKRFQAQKTTYCMIPFIWNVRISKSKKRQKKVVVVRGGGIREDGDSND